MNHEDLANLHPKLYHVTHPDAWPLIQRHGLLSTAAALDEFKVDGTTRQEILEGCRPDEVPIDRPNGDRIFINDNKPMSEKALLKCLDDGLSPLDWLAILNQRVFFWCTEDGLGRMLNAKMNQSRPHLVLTIDTLSLAKAYEPSIEICAINSGSTIRKPARRGLSTFTPLGEMTYADWRKKRGMSDTILEVTVLDRVPDTADFVLDRHST